MSERGGGRRRGVMAKIQCCGRPGRSSSSLYAPAQKTTFRLSSLRTLPLQTPSGRTLHIPLFLVEAFDFIREKGLQTEGLFRREGNSHRINIIWAQFLGETAIPDSYTVFDVCGLVKKFLRTMDPPLLGDLQMQFLQFSATITHKETRLKSVLELCHVLPLVHRDSLAFLMRQLRDIANESDRNKMDLEALATVFAPCVVRDGKCRPRPDGDAHQQLTAAKSDVADRVQFLRLLMENADKIGEISPRDRILSPKMYSDLLPEDDPTTPIYHRLNPDAEEANEEPPKRVRARERRRGRRPTGPLRLDEGRLTLLKDEDPDATRPSIGFIQRNRRGMVHAMVGRWDEEGVGRRRSPYNLRSSVEKGGGDGRGSRRSLDGVTPEGLRNLRLQTA